MRLASVFAVAAFVLFTTRLAHAQNSWPMFHVVLATQRTLPCSETVHDEATHRDENFTMTFDARGRLATRTASFTGGPVPREVTYHRDAAGRVTSEDLREGGDIAHITFEYDAHGRPRTRVIVTPRQRIRMSMTYNPEGRLLHTDYDNDDNGTIDLVETYTYDGPRIRTFEARLGGRVQYTEQYFYDPRGRLDHMERDLAANGTIDLRRTFRYDTQGRLVREENDRGANGSVDEARTYRYDCGGRGP